MMRSSLPPLLASGHIPMLVLLIAACSATDTAKSQKGGTDDTSRVVDSTPPADSTAPLDSADLFCEGQPQVTWANFGHGFLLGACQGCHASTTADRHDAPDDVTFDTVDEAWLWSDRILSRSTGDAPSMPPLGGVREEDRLLLEVWLRCATPGT